jgi:hypothetical protein
MADWYKVAESYLPAPPGITHWCRVTVTTPEGEQQVWVPKTKPLAVCENQLEDDEVTGLLAHLAALAIKRGLLPAETTIGTIKKERHGGLRICE